MTTRAAEVPLTAAQAVRLADYLRRLPGAPQLLAIELIDGGRSNITLELTTSAGPLVLRRPPLGAVAQSANDVGREYRVLHALQGSAVPVPRTVAFCPDPEPIGAPFSLVRKVSGRVLRSPQQVAALSTGQLRGCVDAMLVTLAALHALQPSGLGLDALGRAQGFLSRQVERWQAQLAQVATRGLPEAGELYRGLRAQVPVSARSGLVHGDFRLDNVMVAADDPTRIVAVLDWELATLGDPLADLGLLLVYWDPVCGPVLPHGHPLAGRTDLPGPDALIQRYAQLAGIAVPDLRFHQALGCFKLAVIAEGIHGRHLAGLTVGHGFDTVGGAVVPLLRRGLDLLAS